MDVHGGHDAAVLVPIFEDDGGGCTPSSPAAATTCAATPGRSRSRAAAKTTATTLLDTALREAHEEIGLPPEGVEVLGALPPTPTFVTNYAIYPFVGLIEPGSVGAQHTEVDEVLELSLATCAPATASAGWCGGACPSAPRPTRRAATSSGARPRGSSESCSARTSRSGR